MHSNRLLLSTLVASLVVPVAPAMAQLEEIIVTARKRQESIMKVPVVATVLGAEQLENYASGDLYQITERVPGLNFSTGTLSFGAQISLRGVGTGSLVTTIDQSVSLNIDGMQFTQGLAYASGMFDMEQVEVLKGPQALFYGKASPGGVISIRTADPSGEAEVIVRHGYEFEAEENRTEFILSGPVSDTLGLRLATRFSDSEGFMTNRAVPVSPDTAEQLAVQYGTQFPDSDFPQREEWLVRGTAVWTPTEAFRSRLKINLTHSEADGDGGQTQFASCPDGAGAPAGVPFFHPDEDCRYDDVLRVVWFDPAAFSVPNTGFDGSGIRNNGVPFSEVDQIFGTLEMDYNLSDDLTLTSVTGYYDLEQSSMINGTNSGYAASMIAADPNFFREDFTQEVRLTSDYSDSEWNFMLGAFYQDAKMTYQNNLLINTALYDEFSNFIGLPGLGPVILPPQFNKGYQPIEIETKSIFGQVLWQVTPQLELAGGLRWTDEEREHRVYSTNPFFVPAFSGIGAAQPGEAIPVATATPDLASDHISPELSFTWTPSDDLTIFGSLKKAFKSGSFDTVTVKNPGAEVSFGDEKVTGGELGLKSRLADGQMVFNLAAYYYEFEDLQTGANEVNNEGIIEIRTVNAATAEVSGVEFDMTFVPDSVPGMTLYAAANYNLAEYDNFDTAPCWGGQRIQDGCNLLFNEATGAFSAQDLSGEKLLRAPEWTGYMGFDYETPVSDTAAVAVGWYTSFSSKYLTNTLARDDMWQDAYLTHNASLALRAADGAWEVSLIGNNLTDELVAANCVNANFANANFFSGVTSGTDTRGFAGVEELTCDINNRRSVWLRVSLRLASLFD